MHSFKYSYVVLVMVGSTPSCKVQLDRWLNASNAFPKPHQSFIISPTHTPDRNLVAVLEEHSLLAAIQYDWFLAILALFDKTAVLGWRSSTDGSRTQEVAGIERTPVDCVMS